MRPDQQSGTGKRTSGGETETEVLAAPTAYDSFVVRIWRAPSSLHLRRIEVEHVQSGAISSAGDATPEWILSQFGHCLGDPPPGRVHSLD